MDFVPAKRGDLVVVVQRHVDTVLGKGHVAREDCVVGIVASINREGLVLRYRSVWGGEPVRLPVGGWTLIVKRRMIDVDAAFTAAKKHSWPGHPDQPKPFESIQEARDFLGAFLVKKAVPA